METNQGKIARPAIMRYRPNTGTEDLGYFSENRKPDNVILNAATERPSCGVIFTKHSIIIKRGGLKTREWKTRERQKCRSGKCGSGILGTKTHGWKTREWKSWHQNTVVENARETSMESQNSPNQKFSFTKLVVDHWK